MASLTAVAEHGVIPFAFDTVVQRELHEVEEWLRIDGGILTPN